MCKVLGYPENPIETHMTNVSTTNSINPNTNSTITTLEAEARLLNESWECCRNFYGEDSSETWRVYNMLMETVDKLNHERELLRVHIQYGT
jgi:hypothetical protein